jgi:hypothetical protein
MIAKLGGPDIEIDGGSFESENQIHLFPGQQYSQLSSSRSRGLLDYVLSFSRPFRSSSGRSAFQYSPGSDRGDHGVWAVLGTFDPRCIHHHADFGWKTLGKKRRTFFDGNRPDNKPLSSVYRRAIRRAEQRRGFNKRCCGNCRRVIFAFPGRHHMVQIKD